MAYLATKRASHNRTGPRLTLQVTVAVILALLTTVQLAAAPETSFTTVDNAGNVGQHTSMALNSSGFPVISYRDDTLFELKLATCNDVSCTSPTLTPVDDTGVGGYYMSLALNPISDTPFISYWDFTNTALKVAICNNDACTKPTLTTVDNAGDVGAYTSIALNGAGLPMISYFDDTNDALKVAVCHNLTCTNRTRTTVDSGGVGAYTSLALNSSDFPVISYYDSSNTALKLAVCFDLTCSTLIAQTTVDNSGDVGTHTSMVLNSSGYPIISYRDASNTALKLAICHDPYCTSPSPTLITVDNLGNVGTHTSLVLNSSGHPVISYRDEASSDMKVAVCNDAPCTNPTLTTVDSAGDVGTHTSLALDSSGLPVVSYYDGTNDDLKLAICNICTIPLRTVVDSNDNVGRHTSLVLNSSSLPIISYRDVTNRDLKLAICGNISCSNHALTTVESAGNVGNHTSLAFNHSGFPVISYRKATGGDLKLAVCNNATTCANPTRTIVDGPDNVGTYTSLAINKSGFPVISYYDDTNEDLKLAICNNATCTNPTLTIVDSSTDDAGLFTSLALNSSDRPVISYYAFDPSSGIFLKVAVCNNVTCTNPTLATVFTGGFVPAETSLVLNSSGHPVISSWDGGFTALRLTICNNATCTKPTWPIIDDTANVGRYNSLALNSSGHPVISYYDVTHGNLKIAICNDAVCSNPTLTTVDSSGDVGTYTSLALDHNGYPVVSYYDDTNKDLRLVSYSTETNTSPPSDGMIYLPMVLK